MSSRNDEVDVIVPVCDAMWPCGHVATDVVEELAICSFSPEDGDSMFLRNVEIDLRNHTAPKSKTILALY